MPIACTSAMLITAMVLIVASLSPVHAMTCEDVRNLTSVEQAYWSKRLNLTREQRTQIRQACYGGVRVTRFPSGR
jgi:Spy/CpxP family protein refolding chaperone